MPTQSREGRCLRRHHEWARPGTAMVRGRVRAFDDVEWVVGKDKPTYDEMLLQLSPVSSKITGANAKKEMVKSKLPNAVLGKIWKLADVDRDRLLDDEEFALANHLIKVKLEGHELPPADLPPHLVRPPSGHSDALPPDSSTQCPARQRRLGGPTVPRP